MGTLLCCDRGDSSKWLSTENAFFRFRLIFHLRWAYFPIEIGRNAQWEHKYSMYFDDFSTIYLICQSKSPFLMVKVSLSGNSIYLRLLAMKGCGAIRPGLNCFISMIISVASLSGF